MVSQLVWLQPSPRDLEKMAVLWAGLDVKLVVAAVAVQVAMRAARVVLLPE